MDFPYQFYRVSVGIITSSGSDVILTKAKIDNSVCTHFVKAPKMFSLAERAIKQPLKDYSWARMDGFMKACSPHEQRLIAFTPNFHSIRILGF